MPYKVTSRSGEEAAIPDQGLSKEVLLSLYNEHGTAWNIQKYPHGKGKSMSLESLKYQTCPYDDEEGILLTDIDEMDPQTDQNGELQYYCMGGHHTFSYYENDDDDD